MPSSTDADADADAAAAAADVSLMTSYSLPVAVVEDNIGPSWHLYCCIAAVPLALVTWLTTCRVPLSGPQCPSGSGHFWRQAFLPRQVSRRWRPPYREVPWFHALAVP